MSIHENLIPIPKAQIEANSRKSERSHLTLVDLIHSKSTPNIAPQIAKQHQIRVNEHGEYCFHQLEAIEGQTHTYFDGDQKILEVSSINGEIAIKSLTKRQVNFHGQIKAKKVDIDASGPIHVDGIINVDRGLQISAPAAHFSKAIKSEGVIKFQTKQSLKLEGDISTKSLNIDAAYCHQAAKVQVAEQYNLRTQFFQQSVTSETLAKNFRLVSLQAEIMGDTQIDEKTFLAANTLKFGDNATASDIKFGTETYIHAGNCYSVGNTQLKLGTTTQDDESTFQVDGVLETSTQTKLVALKTKLKTPRLKNHGKLHLTQGSLESNHLEQSGQLIAIQSHADIFNGMSLNKNNETLIYDSQWVADNVMMTGGRFYVHGSHLKMRSAQFIEGHIESENSVIICLMKMLLGKLSQLILKATKLNCQKTLILNGDSTLKENSSIHTADLTGNGDLSLHHSKLLARHRVSLLGKLQTSGARIKKSEIRSPIICLQGDLKLHDLMINDCRHLTLSSEEATLNNCYLKSKTLDLHGSELPDKFTAHHGRFTVEQFNQDGQISLDTTNIVGIKPDVSHIISGDIKCYNSRIITSAQIMVSPTGSIQSQNNSVMKSGRVWNRGHIDEEHSYQFTNTLVQSKGSLSTHESHIYVNERADTIQGSIHLDAQTELFAKKSFHQGLLYLSNRALLAVKRSFTLSREGTMHSKNSASQMGQFLAMGAADLCNSILSAKELSIYDQFSETEQSQTLVSESTITGLSGRLEIQDSQHHSRDNDIHGKLAIDDGLLTAENNTRLSHRSSGHMSGDARLVANNVTVSGTLKLATKTAKGDRKTSPDKDETDSPAKAIPRIIAQKTFATKPTAKVKGDDLVVEAEIVDNDGTVALEDSFAARGSIFSNTGNCSAGDLFLGFDDFVMTSGKLSANHVLIHTPFMFNFFGRIFAKESLNQASLVNFNFGWIAANNSTDNSLFSFDMGLRTPNLMAKPKDIFSFSNIAGVSKGVLTTLFPHYSPAINMAFMLPSLPGTVRNFYHQYQQYDLQTLKGMRRHEFLPLLCQFKSVFDFGSESFNTVNSGFNSLFDIKGGAESLKSTFANSKAFADTMNWQGLGIKTANVFTGTQTNNSLLSINAGFSLGANVNRENLWHFNGGADLAVFSHSNKSHLRHQNDGIQASLDSNITAPTIQNAGALIGLTNLSIDGDQMTNTGITCGLLKSTVKLNALEQAGIYYLNGGVAEINTFRDTEQADTQLDEMLVKGTSFKTKGRVGAKKTYFDFSNAFTIAQTGVFATNDVSIKTSAFSTAGDIQYQNTLSIQADAATLFDTAKETATGADNNFSIDADTITDDSQLTYRGNVYFRSTCFSHGGHAFSDSSNNEQDSIFVLDTTHADLHGDSNIANAYFKIDDFEDLEDFLVGGPRYQAYQFTNSLSVETPEFFESSSNFARDCDIAIKARGIDYGGDYQGKHQLGFESTEGDVALTGELHASAVSATSAKDLYLNHTIDADGNIILLAGGNYYNLGANVTGETVYAQANNIFDITQNSTMAQQPWDYAVGTGGIMAGRDTVFLDATSGNIENYGGLIRGGHYTQLTATGDVLNLCNVMTSQGEHDIVKTFDPGLIAGGDGANTDGVGLYIKAGGKVYSDASDFRSDGDNYIDGKKGITLSARTHTWISRDEKKSGFLGFKKKHIIETTTTVKGSSVHSDNGRNILISEDGGVESTGSQFTSPGGTDIYAKNAIKLYSIKTRDRRFESKTSFWGLTGSKRDEIHESATPTLFADNGLTRIHSETDNVDARGALFIGAGDLQIKSGKKILFGLDTLDHDIKEEKRSFGFSAPGLGAYNTLTSSGGAFEAMSSEDATVAKFRSLYNSGSNAELAANASNLGIQLANDVNSITRGLANDSLGAEMLSRYGLGGDDGFSPTFTLSFNISKTHTQYQTLSQGGVDRGGNVDLEAAEGIELQNGVIVHSGGDMIVDTPEIIATGAALNSSMTQKNLSLSVSFTLTGGITDAGVSYSQSHSQSTDIENAELSADGAMVLKNKDSAVENVQLDGANVRAKTLDANIDKLEIHDKQSTSRSSTTSASASLSGQVSAYHGEGHSEITAKHAGFDIEEGLNSDGHELRVGHLDMRGGEMLTRGENNFKADSSHVTDLHDQEKYTGVGVSVNINDISRLASNKPVTNKTGEKAIPTATLTMDRKDYQAIQHPTIHGERATNIDLGHLTGEGQVHTATRSGQETKRDKDIHVTLDVPLATREHLKQLRDNVQQGSEKITAAFSAKSEDASTIEAPPVDAPQLGLGTQPTNPDLTGGYIDALTSDDLGLSLNPPQGELNESPDLSAPALDDSLSDSALNDFFAKCFESPQFENDADMQAYYQALLQSSETLEPSAVLSEEASDEFNTRLSEAFIDTFKAATEVGWDKVIESLGHEYDGSITSLLSKPETFKEGSIKAYMSGKGILITFSFNLALSGLSEQDDVFKDATSNTAGDVIFGVALSRVAGAAAGPVGLAYTGAGILDNLTYDQAYVDELMKSSYQQNKEAYQLARDGKFFETLVLLDDARTQMDTANSRRAMHAFLQVGPAIGRGIKSTWNWAERKYNERKTRPSQQGLFGRTPPTGNAGSTREPKPAFINKP
jgi:Hemagglutinin repeat